MHSNRNRLQILLSALSALGATAGVTVLASRLAAAPAEKPKTPTTTGTEKSAPLQHALTEEEKIVHILNRLGFGPRPGDVQRIAAMGLQHYIAQQLTPEQIADPTVEQKLTAYPMLQMSNEQLIELYQARTLAYNNSRQLRKRLVSESVQANGGNASADVNSDASGQAANGGDPAVTNPGLNAPGAAANAKAKKAMAQATPEERREVMTARRELMQAAVPLERAQEQFIAAKMLRAVESERQLQEVLVDFWGNHFNIDIRKQSCGILKIGDDRDVIRPHVLGKFRDLLGASAKSPAMLVYLDNFQSTSDVPAMNPARAGNRVRPLRRRAAGPNVAQRQAALAGAAQGQAGLAQNAPQAPAQKKRRGGLNENYAREIMELHTLGVDGGYTQQDVTEVARCFTGWSIGRLGGNAMTAKAPLRGKFVAGAFQFHPALHDNGEKHVLGQVIPAGGGIKDGEQVLDILASHPATMKHLSYQLCQRLVADNPPSALVDKCVATWKRTEGDLREVVRTIVTSPEFYSPAVYRSKIKSPFEYAVSSVRALGGTYQNSAVVAGNQKVNIKPPKGGGYLYLDTTSLIGQVGTMGEPLFQYQAPTGYPEESQKWVSSGALISRMNFSLALTGGKLTDIALPDLDRTLPRTGDTNRFIDQFAEQILHGSIAPATRKTLLQQVSAAPLTASSASLNGAPNTPADRMAALLLGSPEFQRR